MVIITVQFNKIKETHIHWKILADNMFKKYFLISYRRHNFFSPKYIYIFIYLQNSDVSFFEELITVYFYTIYVVAETGQTVSFSAIKT